MDIVWSEFTQSWDSADESQAVWPISALSTEPSSELIYAGDMSGRLTTYTLFERNEPLQRHTSFLCAHTPIRQIHPFGQSHVLVRSDNTLQVRTSGGIKVFEKSTTPNEAFTASAVCERGKDAFVCTSAGAASLLNLERGSVIKRFTIGTSTVSASLEKRSGLLLTATAQGTIAYRDLRSGIDVVQSVNAFESSVGDMVQNGSFVFACGSMVDPTNAYKVIPDTCVRVFDIRKLAEPVSVLDLGEGATPIKLWSVDDTLWICHDSGYVETRFAGLANDWQEVGSGYAEPVLGEYAYASAFCAAPTGTAVLISDTEGILHVWSEDSGGDDGDIPQISTKGNVPEELIPTYSNADDEQLLGVDFDDESVSLSAVGLGPVNERLLSSLYDRRMFDVGRPINKVDASITGNLRQIDNVGYMFNPRKGRRNQQVFSRGWRAKWRDGAAAGQDDAELTMGRSKFLSQQQWRRGGSSNHGESRPESTQLGARSLASPVSSHSKSLRGADIVDLVGQLSVGKLPPKHLQRMRIEYSRFGVEDFDFSLYNSTKCSGLEGDIANSYANALLQVIFYCKELRTVVLSHCATDCPETYCLSCQLGFLFRMLETADGASCHATQLLQVLADRPEAAALALLEDENGNPSDGTSYAVLVQRLLRFVLEQANAECMALSADRDQQLESEQSQSEGEQQHKQQQQQQRIIEQIIGFTQYTNTTCPQCKGTHSRSSHVFAADLDPPQGTSGLAALLAGGSISAKRADMMRAGKRTGILELIARTFSRNETTRAWCAECRKFQLLQTEKYVTSVPQGYLALNFPIADQTFAGANATAPSAAVSATAPGASTAGSGPLSVGAGGSSNASGGNPGADPATQMTSSWQTPLPTEFCMTVSSEDASSGSVSQDNGRVQVYPAKSTDETVETESESRPCSRFKLVAIISSIRDTSRGPEHLVMHTRDPHNADGWLLFNDFLVQPVPEERVVGLNDWWRVPSIAIYANADRSQLAQAVDDIARRFPYKISTRILTSPRSVLDRPISYRRGNKGGTNTGKASRNDPKRNEAIPLTKSEAELLESGDFKCAFDAEFVVLESAKMEVFSDGTQEQHKPPVHTLARLSVVRANGGLLHGMPFIDDYVEILRPIADYASQYSGIYAGDLEKGTSPFKLSTMKEVYKKLRLLADSRCIIIGHGLKHDFRICNIVVPPAQQRDTMVLFQTSMYIRPIALRFLYWFFFQKCIQTREHSSVEDAQATLKVYESYAKSVNEDPEHSISSVLDIIYSLGSQLGWKIPED
ncbi:poly(A)-specific ribonuclease [Coemansia erecta]|uniref:Poly(A)-specific ribonuclease n=1 Tax=Coemansia erecta TaxID=147472 RepID=A0A9W7Y589_9FUNG|nr:poly(A)-specific ribonuclease [Coemansia erecta]